MDPFNASHQATEVEGISGWVCQTMLQVEHTNCRKVEFDGLWFVGIGEVGGK